MKREDARISSAALGLVLFIVLGGASGAAPPISKSSVWRVSSATATVFLAGSVHLLRPSDYPLPPVYDEAYEQSATLLFEVDQGAPTDPEVAKRIAEVGRLPAGETIRNHLEEETYKLLHDYLEGRGIDGSAFDFMKPGMAAVAIAAYEHMRLGAMPHLGVDAVYYNRAIEDGKKVAGLETTEFQLTRFNDLSAEKQEVMLRDTLENMEGSEERSEEVLDAWRSGDATVLAKLLANEIAKDKEIGRVLLFKRNRRWIPKILKLLEGDRNAMVIVGAGHLVGKRSVIELLEERGYEAEQMTFEPAEVADPEKSAAESAP